MATLTPDSAERLGNKSARPKMSSRLKSSASIRSNRSTRSTNSTASLKESKSSSSLFSQSWGLTWRKALVSAPRAVPDLVLRWTSPDGPHPLVIKVPSRDKDRKIPLYVFLPPGVTSKERKIRKSNPDPAPIKCPVIIDFHGGGFILGSCQEQAPFCSKLSRDLECIVISVDYRLGPYDKFPTAYYDAEDILNAILHPGKPGHREIRKSINSNLRKEHRSSIDFDTTKVALSGFSSGGSLALNLAMSVPSQQNDDHPELNIPERWESPFLQSQKNIPLLLYYPALDTRLLPHERPLPPGMEAPKSFWSSLNLEAELMPSYLPKWLAIHPRASPGLVSTRREDNILHSAAKVQMIMPEMDTLAASNELWVKRMQDEGRGGDLEIERVKGMLHGWTQFPDPFLEEEARRLKLEVFEKTVVFVKKVWNGGNLEGTKKNDVVGSIGSSNIANTQGTAAGGVVDFGGTEKDLGPAIQEWKEEAQRTAQSNSEAKLQGVPDTI